MEQSTTNDSKIEISCLSPKCIICSESYDEKDRKPLLLTNCGHTFCKACINQFLTKKCAICRVTFEKTVENWFALEIVALAKVSNSIKPFIDKFNFINEENKNQTLTKFESIRQQINAQTEQSIKLIKKSQSFLLDEIDYEESQFNLHYNEVKNDLEQSLKLFEENLNSVINFDYDEKLEKIKSELNRLETKHGLFKINNLVDQQYMFLPNTTSDINDHFLGCLKVKKNEPGDNHKRKSKNNIEKKKINGSKGFFSLFTTKTQSTPTRTNDPIVES